MKALLLAGVLTLLASGAFGQTPDSKLETPPGHDVSAGVTSYTYREPQGDQPISISGAKFVTDYNGTFALDRRRHWFAQAQARATIGQPSCTTAGARRS